MRKQLLTALAAGAVVLAGCAKIETTEVPESRAIGFDNFVTNAVKSIDDAGALTKFYVYGGPSTDYNDFSGVEVTKAAEGGYEYSPLQYWDESATYQFAAYSDENAKIADNVSFVTDDGENQYHLKIENYTTTGSKDLVYAYADGVQYNTANGTVTMDFRHILSKIIFRFSKNETLKGSDIAVSGVKIKAANNVGTFTGKDLTGNQYDYSCWDAHSGTAEFSFTLTADQLTDEGGSIDTEAKLLIPQPTGPTLLQVEFTLTPSGEIANPPYNKTAETFTVDLPSVSDDHWNPGYVYVYSAEISAENFDLKPIVFDVSMTNNWEDETVTDLDIQ